MQNSASSSSVWPRLSWESVPWAISPDHHGSRREAYRHSGPYQAAVTPAIEHLPVRLEPEVIAEVEDASSELTRFDSDVGHITAPFASILLRTESASSSEIENLTSGARQIGLAELSESDSSNAKLIVSNVRAMQAALTLSDRIDADAIIAMQAALLSSSRPDLTGRWRPDQVWIGGESAGPHNAEFVPPHVTRVPDAMTDLIRFIDRTDVAALAHVAIAHAQFETIHPFPDGNGRTGRALVQAMLRASGLTQTVTVPVSAGLLADTGSYSNALTDYRAGDVDPIARVFARASLRAVTNGRALVSEIERVKAEWDDVLTGVRSHASARGIVAIAVERPVLDAPTVVNALGVTAANAYRALDTLVDRGILKPKNANKRNRIWFAPAVLDALDAFADRARRDRY